MLETVSIAGIVLGAFAFMDPRARQMTALIALVWLETVLCDFMLEPTASVAMKLPIDLVGGLMATMLITRERWTALVPALFVVMLLSHAAFWLAYFNGLDLWYAYVNALNALFLAQMVAVAWPNGGRMIERFSSWISDLRQRRGLTAGLGANRGVVSYGREAPDGEDDGSGLRVAGSSDVEREANSLGPNPVFSAAR